MIQALTPNTQAILLLTAPLGVRRKEVSCDLLTPGEYNRLARTLREKQKQPADLIGTDGDAGALVDLCASFLGRERLEALLGRGFLLSQAVEYWGARAIWVVSRADATYPKRLKTWLKEDAPPLLYGCGPIALLEKGGLAVVGSRLVDEGLVDFTENVGRICASSGRAIVSGGARGIDRAAMQGALRAGGEVLGVLADGLERAAMASENRAALQEGRLVLISPYDPAAGFNVGHAMQRNKLIYALGDAALVVNADFEKGGTWAGAIEQLERFRFGPVFVRQGEGAGKGNAALLHRGGQPWPNPQGGKELEVALGAALEAVAKLPEQQTLLSWKSKGAAAPVPEAMGHPPLKEVPEPEPTGSPKEGSPASALLESVRAILGNVLLVPQTESEVAQVLSVTKPQAKAWLAEFVREGFLEKAPKTRPVRFQLRERLL